MSPDLRRTVELPIVETPTDDAPADYARAADRARDRRMQDIPEWTIVGYRRGLRQTAELPVVDSPRVTHRQVDNLPAQPDPSHLCSPCRPAGQWSQAAYARLMRDLRGETL
jgi:hypothetical protein